MSLFDGLPSLAGRAPLQNEDPTRAPAGVALIGVRNPDSILLIRRAEREGDPWSGQMGLPGGRRDSGDADLVETAIRETMEEVGIPLDRSRLIATLDDMVPMTVLLPRIRVRPFVFLLEHQLPTTANPEVAGSWWIPVAELLRPGTYGNWEVRAGNLAMRRPGYRLEQGIVWGMTERILTPFFQLLGWIPAS